MHQRLLYNFIFLSYILQNKNLIHARFMKEFHNWFKPTVQQPAKTDEKKSKEKKLRIDSKEVIYKLSNTLNAVEFYCPDSPQKRELQIAVEMKGQLFHRSSWGKIILTDVFGEENQ